MCRCNLVINYAPRHWDVWELQVKRQLFLTRVVGEGQLSESRSVFIPREIVRCIRCVIGRMGTRFELPAAENIKASPTENRTLVIRSYSTYREVEILRDCWLQLRCVWSTRKYRQRCIVPTGGTHSSQWDDGLSKGNCRNNKRNISQLTSQHRPDDNEIFNVITGHFLCLYIFLLTTVKSWSWSQLRKFPSSCNCSNGRLQKASVCHCMFGASLVLSLVIDGQTIQIRDPPFMRNNRDFLRFLKSKRYFHRSHYYDLKYHLIVEFYSGKSFSFVFLENLRAKSCSSYESGISLHRKYARSRGLRSCGLWRCVFG